jgi:hypothetical protein
MAERPSTLQTAELNAFLEVSRQVIQEALVRTPHGKALLGSPPEGRHPYLDTRTVCTAIVTFTELGDYDVARSLCSFLLASQGPTGAWSATYTSDALPATSSPEEDVTALVIWSLMTYVRTSGDDSYAETAREYVEEAVRYTRARLLNPYLYLVETTTSLHGPQVSAGYDLWNNCAHAAAFALCHRVYGGERYRRLALLIRRSIGLLMTSEGRFLRRLDPSGLPDPRPDICLIAPDYFSLWAPTERTVMNSGDLIERTLWNVEHGGYIRYLPYSPAERTDLFGPSPRFAAWMARFHYELGNKDRAEAILRWIFDQASELRLAEVLVPVASARRYLPELRRNAAAANGRLGPAESGLRRREAEFDAVEAAGTHEEIVPIGVPLVSAHLETLRALRRGGYLDSWQLDSASARRGD